MNVLHNYFDFCHTFLLIGDIFFSCEIHPDHSFSPSTPTTFSFTLHYSKVLLYLPSFPDPLSFLFSKEQAFKRWQPNRPKQRQIRTRQKPSYQGMTKKLSRMKGVPRPDKRIRETPPLTVMSSNMKLTAIIYAEDLAQTYPCSGFSVFISVSHALLILWAMFFWCSRPFFPPNFAWVPWVLINVQVNVSGVFPLVAESFLMVIWLGTNL